MTSIWPNNSQKWHTEVNEQVPCRATGVIPRQRLADEIPHLKPIGVNSENLALRVPIFVSPTAEVTHDTHTYSMPAAAVGISGTLFLYKDRVHIVAGNHKATHPRLFERKAISRLEEHRSQQLAEVAGR